jgi:superfamily II DNA or RNA helicase
MPFDPKPRVHVCSIQTIVRRLHQIPEPALLIIDESHHAVSASFRKLFDHFPNALILGVTATPIRLNGQGLGEVFDEMIVGPSVQELTDAKHVCPVRYFVPPVGADLSGLHKVAGDFSMSEAEGRLDKPTITGKAIDHYREICDGQPMIVYCTTVQHAKDVAREYQEAGYLAASVDGKMNDEDRADVLEGLADGRMQVVTSCELIGEGLDVKNVVAVQMLRPTESLSLFMQMVGRAMRLMDGKECAYVLDHVGNVLKHGFASAPRTWSLEGTRKAPKPAGQAIRTCEQCFSVHERSPVCPFCEYEYPIQEKRLTSMKMVEGKLIEITQTPEERKAEVLNARSLEELTAIAKARGYSKPHFWALKVWRGRRTSSMVMPRA